MIRKVILFSILFLTGFKFSNAQEYKDLLNLWIDQNYEKLVFKAEKYTSNDKTKNDPLPYLYLCKGLYRISLDEKYKEKEEFKKAESDALNYAVKYTKKDKSGTYKEEAEAFFAEMKQTFLEQTENYMDVKNHKQALGIIKKVVQFDQDNAGAWLIKAVCEFEMKNKTEALKNAELGVKLAQESNFSDMYEVDQKFMRYGLIVYSEYLVSVKDLAKAKSVINIGYQHFSNVKDDAGDPILGNQRYVDVYNSIVN